MKRTIPPLLLVVSAALSHAAEVRWTATGTVSGVTGTGLSATTGAPVSIKFSYDSSAQAKTWDYLYFGPTWVHSRTEFHGNVALVMEVTIGELTWKGSVPVATNILDANFAISAVAWTGGEDKDTLTVTASSIDSGSFSPFPYTGSADDRTIQVILRDTVAPSNFLLPLTFPDATVPVSEINLASGSVTAGSDSIQFSITPASVTVGSDEPRFPLTITKTLTGIELRWPTEDGVSYRLEECDALSGWEPYGTYPGNGSEIVVPLNPFEDHPERRFYRVVTE